MKEAYQSATTTIGHFNNAADSTRQFHEQVQTLTKNLGSLNTIYELELQDTNNHLKAMNTFYSNLVKLHRQCREVLTMLRKRRNKLHCWRRISEA